MLLLQEQKRLLKKPGDMFESAKGKIYRHPTFYDIPDEIGHM